MILTIKGLLESSHQNGHFGGEIIQNWPMDQKLFAIKDFNIFNSNSQYWLIWFFLLDIIKALEERQIVSHDPVEATAQIGSLLEKQGGTIGCLFSIFLYALANSLRLATNYQLSEENQIFINAKCWAEALKNALATLENYTPARTGDRTMMDVLIPFIDTFSSSLDSEDSALKALKLAVELAKNSVESTKFLKPKFGRSTYISYDDIKNSGVPDPGALVVYQIVKSIYDNLQLNL